MDEHAHLHAIRDHELERALEVFPANGVVLDIGAGTGRQASMLASRGYRVTAVDLPTSAYSGSRIFPIIEYDGVSLPVEDASVDVVITSNVLEHVSELDALLVDMARVLKPDGIAVHILPTSSWRFWTTLSHYGWVAKRLVALAAGGSRRSSSSGVHAGATTFQQVRDVLIPARHGERGNTVSELFYFSRTWWLGTFSRLGFEVVETFPVRLFYTGSMVLAGAMDMGVREKLSSVLGSSCRVYVTRVNRTSVR